MRPSAILAVNAVLAAAALLGIAWTRRLVPGRSALETTGKGALLGLAVVSLVALAFPSLAGWPLLVGALVLALPALVLDFSRRRPGEEGRARIATAEVASLALIFLLQGASWIALELQHELPRGWDPSFHCLLIKTMTGGEVPTTWEPWEPVTVSYTLAFHALLAHVARAASVAPHEAFEASYGFFALLLALEMRSLARAVGLGKTGSLGATAAVAFLAWPLRELYDWGGLLTLAGAAAIVAAFASCSSIPGRRGVALAGALVAWLFYAHHLSALIAMTSLVGTSALLWRFDRERARRLVLAALVALVLAVPAIVGYLGKTPTLGSTSVFRFTDEERLPLSQLPFEWGVALELLVLLGLVARGARRGRALGLAWFLVLLLVFLLLDYGYRGFVSFMWGESYSAFTPSRWRMLASLPLCLLAGSGLRALVAGAARRRRVLLRAFLVVLPVLSTLPLASFHYWELTSPSVDPALLDVGRRVREKTPEASIVLLDFPQGASRESSLPVYWFPYLLGRETALASRRLARGTKREEAPTPLPASEPRLDPRVLEKLDFADPAVRARVLARRGKRAFLLRPAVALPFPGKWRQVGEIGPLVLEEEEP